MTSAPLDLDRCRPNVGVVLFHPDGRVWFGRRAGTPGPYNWQFPQGGVDDGENLETAARRELLEETGVVSIEPLGATMDWVAYAYPPDFAASPRARGFIGQKQRWFAYRFIGDDNEVDLSAHGDPEFDAWRWGALDEAPDLIVPFKRAAYEQVVAAFSRFSLPE